MGFYIINSFYIIRESMSEWIGSFGWGEKICYVFIWEIIVF